MPHEPPTKNSTNTTPMSTTMNTNRRSFVDYDLETAPSASRALLAENLRKFGSIPRPLARLAVSPNALDAALAGLSAFEHTSLAPLEREVVAMTVSVKNGCHYCISLHRRLLKMLEAPATLIDALGHGRPLEAPRLEAVRVLTLSLLERTGDVSEAAWQRFLAAGFDRAAALEVVVGVAAYTLTTFANRLTEAPLD